MIRSGSRTLRLGTRRSLLALTQSAWVADRVSTAARRAVETVEIVTAGDTSDAPVAALGTTGVFVTPLRDALLRGEVDFIVHSCKDLPAAPLPGLRLAAVPAREDPRDALVDRYDRPLLTLPPGSRVGTGSARRRVELRRLGLPVTVVPMRGNVDTRLRKLADGEVDALILAAAGVARLGRPEVVTELIDPALMLPAPAQGALAIECRHDDLETAAVLAGLDHAETRAAVAAERSFLAALDAGCTAPVGAYARFIHDGDLALEALAALGEGAIRVSGRCRPDDGVRLGNDLAATVLQARAGVGHLGTKGEAA
jgi:hydroxymethylbilane synthase